MTLDIPIAILKSTCFIKIERTSKQENNVIDFHVTRKILLKY